MTREVRPMKSPGRENFTPPTMHGGPANSREKTTDLRVPLFVDES
jgi:hypothetical protein